MSEPTAQSSVVSSEIVRSALQQVLDYREGKGKFNLSHIRDRYERDNAAHDLWYEVEADVRAAIDSLSTPNVPDQRPGPR